MKIYKEMEEESVKFPDKKRRPGTDSNSTVYFTSVDPMISAQ